MKVLIITRTNWSEPPRIRHQFCRMMLNKGHEVYFLEKPTMKWWQPLQLKKIESNFVLGTYPELLHHQLKFSRILQFFNSKLVLKKLKEFLRKKKFDAVINFNYDYGFLSQAIDNAKFITVINDDFIAQGKPWMKGAIKSQLQSTCDVSDSTLSVSFPLKVMIEKYTHKSKLLLPWCEKEYKAPNSSKERNVVLYFGYINNRIDWKIVVGLLERNIHIRFVGPVNGKETQETISNLQRYPNFEQLAACDYEELNLDDVFCSIAPYDPSIESVQACTISNRAFRLLSSGIPILYPKLPYLLEAPKEVIYGAIDLDDYYSQILFYKEYFYYCQKFIEVFVKSHTEQERYRVIESVVS